MFTLNRPTHTNGSRVRRRAAVAAATVLLGGSLAACSGADDDTATDDATSDSSASASPSDGASTDDGSTGATGPASPSATANAETVEVTVSGDKITPNAQEIEVDKGETLSLVVDSDRSGEFHVHSKPEQYIDFDAGTSTHELTFSTPGEVEIEEHDSDIVVAVVTVS